MQFYEITAAAASSTSTGQSTGPWQTGPPVNGGDCAATKRCSRYLLRLTHYSDNHGWGGRPRPRRTPGPTAEPGGSARVRGPAPHYLFRPGSRCAGPSPLRRPAERMMAVRAVEEGDRRGRVDVALSLSGHRRHRPRIDWSEGRRIRRGPRIASTEQRRRVEATGAPRPARTRQRRCLRPALPSWRVRILRPQG